MRILKFLIAAHFCLVASSRAQPPEPAESSTVTPTLDREYLKKWTPVPRSTSMLDHEKETEPDWVDDRFSKMDTGPAQHYSIRSSAVGLIPKGLAIRLGSQRNAGILFDQETLTVRSYWYGEFLRFPSSRFGILEMPSIAGNEVSALLGSPTSGSDDTYLATYAYGPRVLWEYQRSGRTILETADYEETGGVRIWRRRLEIAPGMGQLAIPVITGSLLEPTDSGPLNSLNSWAVASVQSPVGPTNTIHVAAVGEGITWRNQSHEGKSYVAVDVSQNNQTTQTMEIILVSADGIDRIDWPSIREKQDRVKFPASLREWTHGGPRRWGEPLCSKGVCGLPSDSPFIVDNLVPPFENPYHALFFMGGFDFLADGTAFVCTVHGDVWKVTGIDQNLRDLRWHRFATGLYQPLGVKFHQDKLLILGRDRIVELIDTNSDDEADIYRTFSAGIREFGQPHAYAMSLEEDSVGNLYFIKSGDDAPHGGTMLKVSPDGQSTDVFATGYRHANGLGVGPQDQITSADNEGNWVPATRIDLVQQGGFYGHMPTHRREIEPAVYDPPLCWLPRWLDNSAGGQVWITNPAWAPLTGRMLHLSFGHCTLNLVLMQNEGRRWQGAVQPLPVPRFESGIMRGRFNPADGHLYVSGLDGWQTAAKVDGCLQRVRLSGKPLNFPVGWRADSRGITLDFATPLDIATTVDLSRYRLQQWQYRWTPEYGSPHYSISDPLTEGQDDVPIESAELSRNGMSLRLNVPSIRPVMQMHLQANLLDRSQQPVDVDLCSTIHFLPAETAAPPAETQTAPSNDSPAAMLFAPDNLVAWCIVPFDAKKRMPEERAIMLGRLGIKRLAYDYRAEHVPLFQAEIDACRKHAIEISAWWFPTELNKEATEILDILKTNKICPDLWVMGGGTIASSPDDERKRIHAEVKRIGPIADAAAKIGCRVCLYNHGGWFGIPENQLKIVQALHRDNVGIVYNLHHAHEDLDRLLEVLKMLGPHLTVINLNGMTAHGDALGKKILPLGAGDRDLEVLQAILASGFRGRIGILNHTDEDAEARLQANLDGLRKLTRQLKQDD